MANGDVVIVSRFGSKAGGTPGNYIRRYTSRLDATEALTPYTVAQTLQDYQRAYDERNRVSEKVIAELGEEETLVREDEKVTDQSARLFGNEGLVYSKEQFSKAINDTEAALEDGHTLITPVISFKHDYLKRYNVIPDDMEEVENNKGEGDYFGNVDQLKLRRAITKGMTNLCDKSYFVEPVWTAAVQVDTANVHVHVTLIETADKERIPKERFVKSPRQEVMLVEGDDGDWRDEVRLVRDKHGKLLTDNLGERGKLQPRAMRGFREGVDQSFIRMQSSKPFTSDLSAHSQLVKQHSTQLSLAHTVLSSQLVQIYEALPKHDGEEPDSSQTYDAELRSQQPNWRAGSNRQSMKKANTLAYEYVDHLLEEHRMTVGYDDYEQALDHYTESKAPDLEAVDNTAERERLKGVVTDRLKEEMVNGLYKELKPLRVVSNKAQFEQDADTLLDDRERVVVEGQLTPKGLQMALLDDEQLKDLIADELEEETPSLTSSALTMEKRLRDYPKRHKKASNKKHYYDRMADGYDRLADSGHVSEESQPMRDMFAVEKDYHSAVEDKYSYLIGKRFKSYLDYKGDKYPVPDEDRDAEWVDVVHPSIKQLVKDVAPIPETEATQKDLSIPERLPNPMLSKLEGETDDGLSLKEAIRHNNQVRTMSRTYDSLHDQIDARREVEDVSKERFDDVKSYDLIETVYDFDADADRHVSDKVVSDYKSVMTRRDETFERAINYLNQSHQNTSDFPEYTYYKDEHEGVKQALEFTDVTERTGELPKPLRRHHKTHEAMESLEGQRVLPANEAKDFNVEFLDTGASIVEEELASIEAYTQDMDVDEAFDINEELLRLNQYHVDRLKKDAEEEEAERQADKASSITRVVPLPDVDERMEQGDLDEAFAREVFKDFERKLIPRYVASYYETSYNDPEFEL